MSTTIYGHSDDLIEFEGDVDGEAHCDIHKAVLIVASDGTCLRMHCDEDDVWRIKIVNTGMLLDRIDVCFKPSKDNYSDIVHFLDGLERIFVASNWQVLRKQN